MNEIHTEFDNLSGLNDAKVFDQSHDADPSIFDVPQAFQEFDAIESEINRNEETLNEVSLFSDRLNQARVVRREDAIALESIIGELNDLPNIYSYTEDYSLVNYNITQEAIFNKVKEVISNMLSSVWKFILTTMSNLTKHVKSLFDKNKYANSPVAQKTVIKTQSLAVDKLDNKTQGNPSGLSSKEIDERNVRINKQLRDLLYPAFSELTTLSNGGAISGDLLVREMCDYRFKPFYTVFLNAMFNKDNTLLDFSRFCTTLMSNDVDPLVLATTDVVSNDMSQPVAVDYAIRYGDAPEQLKTYVKQYSGILMRGGNTAIDNEFRRLSIHAESVTRNIMSLNSLVDLPDSTVLLQLDLSWLFTITTVDRKILNTIDSNFNKLKKMKIDADRHIHPSNRDNIRRMYSDWLIMNKIMIINSLFVSRMDKIVRNYETLMDYIVKAMTIIEQK